MTDVVVLGAGAAGLMCAAVAAQRGRSVVVLELNDRAGKKIRISGGGRCNFTNIGTTHVNFLSRNPDFCRSALSRYSPRDFLDLVESYGITWHEKKLGQLFCDGSAQQIIDMLLAECDKYHVDIRYNTRVVGVDHGDAFCIRTSGGDVHAHAVVVATGGLSIPTLGATDVGYRIAKQFSVGIVETAPALVPVTFAPVHATQWGALSGASIDATVETANAVFRENILFTHRGLSGPAILQASSYLESGNAITIDLLPDMRMEELFPEPNRDPRAIATVLGNVLPRRFVDAWGGDAFRQRIDQTSSKDLHDIISKLKSWQVYPSGTEGYAKAEVTRGGIDTDELSQQTLECKRVPGLYFIGEVVDVTGWLGGYNFQWAWASAVAAGNAC